MLCNRTLDSNLKIDSSRIARPLQVRLLKEEKRINHDYTRPHGKPYNGDVAD